MFKSLPEEKNSCNRLNGRGWTVALVQANIASSGTADSFIKASHLRQTRHAYQVTAANLYILMQQVYKNYTSNVRSSQAAVVTLEKWAIKQAKGNVQFDYWFQVLTLEINLLLFIRSLREGNFQLYFESLNTIVP